MMMWMWYDYIDGRIHINRRELIARARRASETNRCGYSDTKYERSYNDFMGKALQEKYKKEIEAIVAAKEAERRIQFAAYNNRVGGQ